MNTNRYFSLSRFGLLLKHDLIELWKSYFRALCIMFLGTLVVYYMGMRTYNILTISNSDIADVESYIKFHVTIFTFFYAFYLLIKAAQFMEPLYTKEARIRYLMLPATSLEKFISRALGVTLIPTVIFVAAILLADVVRFAIYPFFPNLPEEFKIWVVPELWKELMTTSAVSESVGLSVNIKPTLVALITYSFLIASCLHSICILVGILFGRQGVSVIVIIVTLSTCWGFPLYSKALTDWGLDVMCENGGSIATYMINLVCLSLNIFIWWLSYKIFSRKQVIQPKFSL